MKLIIFLAVLGLTINAEDSSLSAEEEAQILGIKKLIGGATDKLATCNTVFFSEQVDYNTAVANCQNFVLGGGSGVQQGNLATVNNDEKNNQLVALLKLAYPGIYDSKWAVENWVWAGLQKVTNTKGGKKGVFVAEDWKWADNVTSVTDYEGTKWMKNQPDQAKKNGLYQNQMRISRTGVWDDAIATKTHPYACDYQGKYILSAQKMTWAKANEMCTNASLILATVKSQDDIDELKAAAVSFLGEFEGKKWDWNNWLWLGAINRGAADGTSDWYWMDGTEVNIDALPWMKRQPDIAQTTEKIEGVKTKVIQDRLSMSKKGKFDDSYYYKERLFACQCPDSNSV